MENTPLHQSLQQLHAELEHTQSVDDELRQELEHLRRDIQTVLKESDPATRKSIISRLDKAISHFEDSHVDITLKLKQLLDSLAQV
jgi:hypothetical protein